jgi:signal transduction histidine kinase
MTAALVIAVIAVLALGRRVVADHERMRLVAEAEHELRGPLQVLTLAADAARLDLQPELERARIALADLSAARSGRRASSEVEPVRLDRLVWRAATASDLAARRAGGGVHLDWSAGPVTVNADRGRLSQALGNLLANAVEHGGGQIRVVGRRTKRGIRVEVRDSGRGHGLTIATKAVRDSGGTLRAGKAGTGTAVAFELPIADADAPAADAREGAEARDRGSAEAHPLAALRRGSAAPPAAA